jgi:hypothetical protein
MKYKLSLIFVFVFLVSSMNVFATVTTSGNMTINGLYTTIICYNNCTLTSTTPLNVSMVLVAGGGSGGWGGGGAGGFYNNSNYQINIGTYNIVIGLGALGVAGAPGNKGGDSSFGGLINVTGGGLGGFADANGQGGAGGSGGAGGAGSSQRTVGGLGTIGQGYMGGCNANFQGSPYPSGGGGGAGCSCQNATGVNSPCAGGIVVVSNITGIFTNYSCGGGGTTSTSNPGVSGGCSLAGNGSSVAGGNATGYGSGGGGSNTIGGNGYQGIFIISYLTNQGINFVPPSDVNVTKYLPSNYILVNVTLSGNYTNMTIYLQSLTSSYNTSYFTTNLTQFVNFTVPFKNDTYTYYVIANGINGTTTSNYVNNSIQLQTVTNYINIAPPSESNITKYIPNKYILVNFSINMTNYPVYNNMTIYLYNSTGLYSSYFTTNLTQFVNFTVPLINMTYYYNATTYNNDSIINSLTYTNYIQSPTLNISVYNISVGSVQNFNINVTDMNTSYTLNYSVSLGYVIVPISLGDNYYISVTSNLYNPGTATYSSSQNMSQSFNITLTPFNTVNINVRNELTGAILYVNESMSFVSDGGSAFYDWMNGSKTFYYFNTDYYSMGVSASGYSSRSYRQFFNNSYLNLTMYLNNGSAVVFNFKTNGGLVLTGVLFNVSTYVNGSLTLVESRVSDISGKISISLLSNTAYFFTASLNGYITYPSSLNPVIYSSYDITMSPLSGGSITPTAIVSFSPTTFFSGTPNMSLYVASSYCSLVIFNYTISWLGGSSVGNSTNPCSAYFSIPLNLTSSPYVIVNYNYTLNNGASYSWINTYYISRPQGNHTITNLGQNYYGMLIGDRVMLSTFYVLIVMGIAFVALGVGGSVLFGAIFWLLFGQSGFVPIWILYPSLVIGFLLIINRGSK